MLKRFLQGFLNFGGLSPKRSGNLNRRGFLILTGGMFLMGKYLSPHFQAEEVRCHGTGKLPWDDGIEQEDFMKFLTLLEEIRKEWGKPIFNNSFYRSPEHNAKVSAMKTKDGPHTGLKGGFAIDVRTSAGNALDLIRVALIVQVKDINPIQGVGQKGHGPHSKRFVHIDNLPRKASWTYPA